MTTKLLRYPEDVPHSTKATFKDITFVTDFFHPESGERSQRMNERAEYLVNQGCHVTVICPWREGVSEDSFSPSITIKRVRPIFHKQLPSLIHSDYKNSRYPILKHLRPLLGYIRWLLPAILEAYRDRSADKCLYTMNNPTSLHVIGYVCSFFYGRWLAEIRDPIVNSEHSHRGLLRKLFDKKFEHLVLQRAQRSCMRTGLHISEVSREAFTKCGVSILPDYGVDVNFFKNRPQKSFTQKYTAFQSQFTGIYAGDIDAGDGLDTLSSAIGKINNNDAKITLALNFFSPSSNNFQSLEHLTYMGHVPYQELLTHFDQSDFCLILDLSTLNAIKSNNVIPSKLCEQIALQKPVLLIGNTSSFTARLITDNNIGVAVNNTIPDIEEGLAKIVRMIKSDSYNYRYFLAVEDEISNDRSEHAFMQLLLKE